MTCWGRWLYTQDQTLTDVDSSWRHAVNPNFNDRLFLGAGFKYCYVYPYLGKCFGNDPIWLIHIFQIGWWFNHPLKNHWSHPLVKTLVGLSKFKMPPIILGVSSSVPNFKGRDVETTNSWKTSGPPYISHSPIPPWKNPQESTKSHDFFHLVPGKPKVIKRGNSSTSSGRSASFKFLVGCRRVESRTTTLQDRTAPGPEAVADVSPMWFFLSFQRFQAKHNRFGKFWQQMPVKIFKKSET